MRELATIVVPVFDIAWHPMERRLLHHAVRTLDEFSLIFVCQDHLDITQLALDYPQATFYRFDVAYFADRKGYTRLLLRPEFYELFGWSEYLLLFEPRSYVVTNQLRYWCKQGHDYVTDRSGRLSLRHVDRFTSLTRKGGRKLHSFLAGNDFEQTDRPYWYAKTTGFWPSLRAPTGIVSDYFSLPAEVFGTGQPTANLPFAIADFDIRSEAHEGILRALQP